IRYLILIADSASNNGSELKHGDVYPFCVGYHMDITMENELARLNISDGEEEAWQLYEGL
ncbi:hypothetical protein Godav_011899, partial [Gossypium davidsonii]|nr:hypothetical protein [Gossypium davidsonii]